MFQTMARSRNLLGQSRRLHLLLPSLKEHCNTKLSTYPSPDHRLSQRRLTGCIRNIWEAMNQRVRILDMCERKDILTYEMRIRIPMTKAIHQMISTPVKEQ